jgi:hypothetical protein
MKTNQTYYLSVIYFVIQPLHVSCTFIAHYQEVLTVYAQQLAAGRIRMEFHPDPRAARTNRCTKQSCNASATLFADIALRSGVPANGSCTMTMLQLTELSPNK